jgi:hypothetical protein
MRVCARVEGLSRQLYGCHAEVMVEYRVPGPITFDAVIEAPAGPGAYVTFPFNAVDVFGVRARVPVKARFDATVDYTGSLAPYGGRHRLGVRKDVQSALGKTRGDTVTVELTLDTDRAAIADLD